MRKSSLLLHLPWNMKQLTPLKKRLLAIMALLAFASLLKLLSADGEIGLKYCTNSKFSRSHQSGICLITAFSKDISVLSSVAVKS